MAKHSKVHGHRKQPRTERYMVTKEKHPNAQRSVAKNSKVNDNKNGQKLNGPLVREIAKSQRSTVTVNDQKLKRSVVTENIRRSNV